MIKRINRTLPFLLVLLGLSACGKQALRGTYVLSQPWPENESVVKEINFTADTLTMRSETAVQTVEYELRDGTLTIFTDYGDFSYDIEQKEDRIILDEQEYVRQ